MVEAARTAKETADTGMCHPIVGPCDEDYLHLKYNPDNVSDTPWLLDKHGHLIPTLEELAAVLSLAKPAVTSFSLSGGAGLNVLVDPRNKKFVGDSAWVRYALGLFQRKVIRGKPVEDWDVYLLSEFTAGAIGIVEQYDQQLTVRENEHIDVNFVVLRCPSGNTGACTQSVVSGFDINSIMIGVDITVAVSKPPVIRFYLSGEFESFLKTGVIALRGDWADMQSPRRLSTFLRLLQKANDYLLGDSAASFFHRLPVSFIRAVSKEGRSVTKETMASKWAVLSEGVRTTVQLVFTPTEKLVYGRTNTYFELTTDGLQLFRDAQDHLLSKKRSSVRYKVRF
jgi:hypothetical protein